MKLKPLTLTIVLGTIILIPSILVGVTMSDFPTDPDGEYSPWVDLNDDGIVDIFDVVWLASRYSTAGTPLNKTALLYNVSDTFNLLLSMIDDMNTTIVNMNVSDTFNLLLSMIDDMNTTIVNMGTTINHLNDTVNYLNNTCILLNNTVTYLNETVTYLNGTGLSSPDYDSGWFNLTRGDNVLSHNLGTTEVFVYFVGRNSSESNTHQLNYGGTLYGSQWYGARFFELTSTNITITRMTSDNDWIEARVQIWKIPQP